MEQLDPRRAFGNFLITTTSGTPYTVEVRRSKVIGSFGIHSPREEHSFPVAFVECNGEHVFRTGAPMHITMQGGRRSYVTSPIEKIEHVGLTSVTLGDEDNTQFTITTEKDGTFTALVGDMYGRCLLEHPTLYPDGVEAYLAHGSESSSIITVGKELFVHATSLRRLRRFSRIVSIVTE